MATISHSKRLLRGEMYYLARALKLQPIPKAVHDYEATGQQTMLPGAERVTDGVVAQRRAEAPLKPKATQRPCDAGLFSDDANQLKLV